MLALLRRARQRTDADSVEGVGYRGVSEIRNRRNTTTSTPLKTRNGRLKYKVRDDGCWQWLLNKDKAGYGTCGKSKVNNENYAHRAVYIFLKGLIPIGMTLDHLCRNRWCVNPNHMEPVSLKENVRRAPRTKLTTIQVDEIKKGTDFLRVDAFRYRVTRQTIWRIRKGLMWQ